MVNNMSQWTDMYRQKVMLPKDAVMLVQSGDWVDYGMAQVGIFLFGGL